MRGTASRSPSHLSSPLHLIALKECTWPTRSSSPFYLSTSQSGSPYSHSTNHISKSFPLPTPPFLHYADLPQCPTVNDPTTSTITGKKTGDISLSIGILLLELLFGQSLESRPERTEFLRPDGTPNKYTDYCTATEWQRTVEMEVGDGIA
ncbi:hypothetical protein QBC38DRAFT_518724 [Podospora fimiseda]|uniref:Uncharacterized protein n=1 Tax=Podospora fimiseda TaxID=252190 RepID=A0AAN6YPP3_9PEZI|nr:hypothetical protein QBC38DRAFT_518724 [Podospora fimiseda]